MWGNKSPKLMRPHARIVVPGLLPALAGLLPLKHLTTKAIMAEIGGC